MMYAKTISHIMLVLIISQNCNSFNLKTRSPNKPVTANNCIGIDIGTEPNNYDIVSNGVISEAWSIDSKIPYYVGYDDKFEFLYISNDYEKADAGAEDRFDLMKSKLLVKADRQMDLQPIFRKNADKKYELELDYQCSSTESGIVDIIFTFETEEKSCSLSIHWKKECLRYSRPVYSLNVEVEGLHNEEGVHMMYRNGHVTSQVGEREATRLDKMGIDNAIQINFTKKLILSYWTTGGQIVKDLIQNNEMPENSDVNKEYQKMESFYIERPKIIFDKQLLDIKYSGSLSKDLRISSVKRYFFLEFTCKYYVPEATTTLGIMIIIPGYDDYATYFFGLCDMDKNLPHTPRYDNPINAENLDLFFKKPLIVEPKFIYEKTQSDNNEQSINPSEVKKPSGAKMAEDPKGVPVPTAASQVKFSGMNDIELDYDQQKTTPVRPIQPQITNSQQMDLNNKTDLFSLLFTRIYEQVKVLIFTFFGVATCYIIVQGFRNPKALKKRLRMFIEMQDQKYSPISQNEYTENEDTSNEINEDDEDNAI